MSLTSRHILLGVTGSIAAYKTAELIRLLRQQHAEVQVVMTASATAFITPLTLQTLSGHAVKTQLLDADAELSMDHIHLARWADSLLIAPASANIIGKLAHGLADDLLSTLYLAATCPVYLAPAMNQAMWHHAAVQANVQKLRTHGVHFIGPERGEQACGDNGLGRMSAPELICASLFPNKATPRATALDLTGISVLISAGPTREPIDPVRYISNRSSGKMGYALAQAAYEAGASVTLVSGPVAMSPLQHIKMIYVETAAEMFTEVLNEAPHHAIYIGAAAVADYCPAKQTAYKLKKTSTETQLLLEPTRDILASVAALEPPPFTVGFAAETDNLEDYAKIKLQQKKLNMIAANWVGKKTGGFDSDDNALNVYWHAGQQHLPMQPKTQLAHALLSLIYTVFTTTPPHTSPLTT
ncbi:MAG: bifunctional phosphopantothenoylcysteine decarboxylase/phosphopantothenate--cysteine ligase CoaBC [Methylovulum sp.]|jgi:phosphopantothenoylcysteine decarboxylase/phosphopantothenate--cysteine ligase